MSNSSMYVLAYDTIRGVVRAHIIPGAMLEYIPRWDFVDESVAVAPYTSKTEWVEHVDNTVGSAKLGVGRGFDELRFGKDDLLLRSAMVGPTENTLETHDIASWPLIERQTGLVRLVDNRPFSLPTARTRWFAPDGSVLAGLNTQALVAAREQIRLTVAQDFDLLFSDGYLCGWMLTYPQRYLVTDWEEPDMTAPDDSEVVGVLYEYIHALSLSLFDAVEDRNPAILACFRAWYARLDPSAGAQYQRRVLRRAIKNMCQEFFDIDMEGDS